MSLPTPDIREVLNNLLEHYLNCYDGNADQLAIDARALLDSLPSPVSVPEGDAREVARRIVQTFVWAVAPAGEDDDGDERLTVLITAALLSADSRARREGREEMRERAAQYFRARGNMIVTGILIADIIERLSSPEEG